jgi:tetratricopeptide (TPR) repeat protein
MDSFRDLLESLKDTLIVPLTWTQVVIALTVFAGAVWGWIKLFVETGIKERVKAEFDRSLASHKDDLDREKQKAVKTFSLFSEKKYDINAQIYVALRSAYQNVNAFVLGGRSPINTILYSSAELDEFLIASGAKLDTRKSLIQLHEIDPEIASIEINRDLLKFEREKLSTDLAATLDLTYTNELFLARPVVGLCDEIIELLRTAISIMLGSQSGDRVRSALKEVPVVLAKMVSEMRSDLLGVSIEHNEDLTVRRSNPLPPVFHGLPESIPISDIAENNTRTKQLTSYRLQPDEFRKSAEDRERLTRSRLDAANVTLEKNPSNEEARKVRLGALMTLGRLDLAEKDIEFLLEQEPTNLEATFALAECHLRRNRQFDALQKIGEYLQRREDDARAYILRGTALMSINRSAAIADLQKAISLEPESALAHARLGENLWREKRITEAAVETAHALSLRPDDPVAQFVRLELLAEQHVWAAIAELSEELLLVLPNNPRVISLIGRALNLLERFDQTIVFANRFLGDDKRELSITVRSNALAVRAAARFGLKEYKKSVADADGAIDGAPPERPTFIGLYGDAHFAIGLYGDAHFAKIQSLAALQCWDEAIVAAKAAYRALEPGTYESAQVLKILEHAFKNIDGSEKVEKTTGKESAT